VTDDQANPVRSHIQGSTVDLVVAPRSSVTRLERDARGALRARVTAPPVDGAANAVVLRLLADVLDVPPSRISVLTGASGRRKRLLVSGLPAAALAERLEIALARR
jgi:uncharacterized protein YggU (UPF0235/DUF167 family)